MGPVSQVPSDPRVVRGQEGNQGIQERLVSKDHKALGAYPEHLVHLGSPDRQEIRDHREREVDPVLGETQEVLVG